MNFEEKEAEQKERIIAHIFAMKKKDIELARQALRWYHNNQPHLGLLEEVRKRIHDNDDQV
jgi:hypothetical protein